MRTRHPFAAGFVIVLLAAGCLNAGAERTAGPASVQTTPQPAAALALTLPNKPDSLKFAVMGDFGNGSRAQYEMASTMKRVHDSFKYEFVLTVGDNLYGSERPQDFKKKFEDPYKPLLDAGVKFYATLGNHDAREQRYYKLFNMDGKLYYTFKAPQEKVRFFALESTYLDQDQLAWIKRELETSTDDWKIVYFHHPPYSSGGRHGSDSEMRSVLEPLFLEHNVSVVFTGHDHFYERVKPQKGIVYFVVGNTGQLRKGDLENGSPLTAKGFDTDLSFLAVEISGDEMHFNAISRTGQIIDSGVITRRK
jgi:predicted phosphodiesterase